MWPTLLKFFTYFDALFSSISLDISCFKDENIKKKVKTEAELHKRSKNLALKDFLPNLISENKDF